MNAKEHFPFLDIFRIAICVVILLFHAIVKKIWLLEPNTAIYINLYVGAIYMDAFFILSGFLLFYLHGEKFCNITEGKIKNFYIKRLIRIYPQYIFYFLTILLCTKQFNPIILPVEILCLQGFFPSLFKLLGNGGTWFISCLFFSYLLFPIVSKLVLKTKKNFLSIILIYLLLVYISMLSAIYKMGWVPVYINPIYRMLEFAIGMYLANIFIQCSKIKNINYVFISLISILLLFALVPILYKNNYINGLDFKNIYIYYNCITIPLFSIIIFSLAKIKNKLSEKLNKSRLLSFLAKITFPFYLWQGLAQTFTKQYFMNSKEPIFWLIAMCFTFSIVAYLIFDKFLTNKINSFLASFEREQSLR